MTTVNQSIQSTKTTRSFFTRSAAIAGVAATLAVASLGFAGAAQARDNVAFSVGIGIPGVAVGVSNAYPVYQQPVYQQQPVYVQQAPVYVQPRPIYVQPRPVYVQPAPVYYAPAPVYYGRPHGPRHGGYYGPGPRPVTYGPSYYRGDRGARGGPNRAGGYGQVYINGR